MVRHEPPLGPAIRRRRQELGLTQADLAKAADIADETVSRIERGRLTPSVTIAEKVAAALQCTLPELRAQKPPKAAAMRPAEARLLALVSNLDDASVDDVARAVKMILAVGRKTDKP